MLTFFRVSRLMILIINIRINEENITIKSITITSSLYNFFFNIFKTPFLVYNLNISLYFSTAC